MGRGLHFIHYTLGEVDCARDVCAGSEWGAGEGGTRKEREGSGKRRDGTVHVCMQRELGKEREGKRKRNVEKNESKTASV